MLILDTQRKTINYGRSIADCIQRGIDMMKWLTTRPETEIAVVTHSSWLKHLFRAFGKTVVEHDKEHLHRVSGNAEVRSICLALHKGFYPDGEWKQVGGKSYFEPADKSFRKGRWAPTNEEIAHSHKRLQPPE